MARGAEQFLFKVMNSPREFETISTVCFEFQPFIDSGDFALYRSNLIVNLVKAVIDLIEAFS